MAAPVLIRTGNSGLQSSSDFQIISPANGADLAFQTRAIYVGGAGDLTVQNSSGVSITFLAVPAGAILPIVTSRVMLTGTTATGLVALY